MNPKEFKIVNFRGDKLIAIEETQYQFLVIDSYMSITGLPCVKKIWLPKDLWKRANCNE